MKNTNKILLILLTLALCLSLVFTLASCGDNTPEDKDEPVKKETFTVTFDSNGGSEVASQTVEGGKYVEKPADPTKDGYTFLGWYVEDEKWSFIGYVVAKNITLTAKWESIGTAGLKYSEIDNGLSVIGYEGTATEVVIPEIVDEKPVIEIAEKAFYENTSITSVTILDSVTSIGNQAFYNCKSLTSITVSAGNPNYKDIDGNLYTKDGKTLVQYAIGKTATSFAIPDSVTKIGNNAFDHCTSLTSVTIGNSVTSIGSYAFDSCTSLTNVTIPDSVTSIGMYAFYWCTSLEEIYFNATAMNDLSSSNYVFYNAGQKGDGIKVVIGKNVTKIPAYLFYPCYVSDSPKITSVVFEEGSVCESIGSGAFSGCTSLTRVTIPDSVTSIGDGAFSGCTSLTRVTIGNSVTSIGDEAFYNCYNLKSITIPDSVTKIGNNAFYGCKSLTSVTIHDSVTSIGEWAFAFCSSLISVTILDSVTSIGSYAFYGCKSLTSVTIPDSVTSIGDYAFYECYSLTKINYCGTWEQWEKITKGEKWNYDTGDYTIVYNYTEE